MSTTQNDEKTSPTPPTTPTTTPNPVPDGKSELPVTLPDFPGEGTPAPNPT